MMRFDRFTAQAQDVAARAYEIFQRFNQNQIDSEHMLLAVLEQPDGMVAKILEHLGVDAAAMHLEVEEYLRNNPTNAATYAHVPNQVFITPRVKRIIDLANEEANGLKDNHIAPEHLFLAMCREKNTALAHIFERRQLTRPRVYQAIKTLNDQRAAERPKEYADAWAEIANELARTAVEHNLDPMVGRLLIQLITTMSRSRPQ